MSRTQKSRWLALAVASCTVTAAGIAPAQAAAADRTPPQVAFKVRPGASPDQLVRNGGCRVVARDRSSGIHHVDVMFDGKVIRRDHRRPFHCGLKGLRSPRLLRAVAARTPVVRARAVDRRGNTASVRLRKSSVPLRTTRRKRPTNEPVSTVSSPAPAPASAPASASPDSSSAAALFSSTFDGTSLAAWTQVHRAAADRLQVVDAPGAQGAAARFTTCNGDVLSPRPTPGCSAPVNTTPTANPRVQLNTGNIHREGDDQFISWSTMFPADFPTLRGWSVFFQFHGAPYSGSPRIGFGMSGDRIALNRDDVYNYDQVWSIPLERETWHRFVLHVKWSKNASVGFIELWHNGAPQRFSNGSTRLNMATIQSDQSAVETIATNYRQAGLVDRATLFHDEVRVSTSSPF